MSSLEQCLQCALCSTLHVKRADCREFQASVVVALYGCKQDSDEQVPVPSSIPSHLQVFREGHIPCTSTRPPNYSISLESSQVCTVKLSSSSSKRQIEQASQSFCVTTKEKDFYEFRASSESECQLWMNIIKFLIIFPYSCLPQEPHYDSSTLDFSEVLNPKLYRADSVWPVYISPEEVASKRSIKGPMVLALRGRVSNSRLGKMELYSPEDHMNPVLSCKHDSVRCTGKMGKFVYVELGSRCKGGPGLLWMYFGSKERANLMKDIFYLFLVKQQVCSHGSLQQHCPSPPIPPRSILSCQPEHVISNMPKSLSSPKLLSSSPSKSHHSSQLAHKMTSPNLTTRKSSQPRPLPQTLSSPHLLSLPQHKSSSLYPRQRLHVPTSSDSTRAICKPPPLPPRSYLSSDKNHSYHELEPPLSNSQEQPHHYDMIEPIRRSSEQGCTAYLEPKSDLATGKTHDYHILESTSSITGSLVS